MLLVGFSRLKSWRRCHRLYNYRYVQGLQRKRPALPLIRGTMIHKLFDGDAKGLKPASILADYEKQYGKLFREEQEYYGDLIGDVRVIYDGYRAFWAGDGYKVVESEFEMRIPIPTLEGRVEFKGNIDKIWVDKQKRRWLVDHKTHKNIPGDEQRFSDLQTVFYVWAWNLKNPRRPVDGIIWDYLRTKRPSEPEVLKNGSLSKRASIDTTYATAERVVKAHCAKTGEKLADYREWLDGLKDNDKKFFKRVHLPNPPKGMIEQIVNEMVITSTDVYKNAVSDASRNMTRDCSWCEYYNLCHAELRGQDAEFLRKTDFVVNPEMLDGDQEEEE